MSTALRRFLLFVAALIPVTILAFLAASDFFGAWNGRAVSVRPQQEEGAPSHYQVLIVNNDDTTVERTWPAARVDPLKLPVDPFAITPDTIPAERPRTTKSSYTLHYLLEKPNGEWETVPTTSPASLGVGFLVFVLGIAVRNMIVAGSPFSLQPRGLTLPKAQAPSGQVATRGGNRPKKGPPPGRRRKGVGRR